MKKYFEPDCTSKFSAKKYRPLLSVDFLIGSNCCDIMKKNPVHGLHRTYGWSITGQMANESVMRLTAWLKSGCNMFDNKYPVSNPMSFWTDQDVLQYLKLYNIPYASVYGDIVPKDDGIWGPENCAECELCTTGAQRTGCIFCAYGAHMEKGEGRFERLKRTHPKLWNYAIYGGGYDPEDGLWKPTKEGLGMGHVFDTLNDLYSKKGKLYIPYGKED